MRRQSLPSTANHLQSALSSGVMISIQGSLISTANDSTTAKQAPKVNSFSVPNTGSGESLSVALGMPIKGRVTGIIL